MLCMGNQICYKLASLFELYCSEKTKQNRTAILFKVKFLENIFICSVYNISIIGWSYSD